MLGAGATRAAEVGMGRFCRTATAPGSRRLEGVSPGRLSTEGDRARRWQERGEVGVDVLALRAPGGERGGGDHGVATGTLLRLDRPRLDAVGDQGQWVALGDGHGGQQTLHGSSGGGEGMTATLVRSVPPVITPA